MHARLNDGMETLELSLASLATISRHVEKSHGELSKYLTKQVSSSRAFKIANTRRPIAIVTSRARMSVNVS